MGSIKISELSDYFIDHLIIRYEHWIMEHGERNSDIESFIDWCKKEEVEYLNVKRGPDNKSYLERENEKSK